MSEASTSGGPLGGGEPSERGAVPGDQDPAGQVPAGQAPAGHDLGSQDLAGQVPAGRDVGSRDVGSQAPGAEAAASADAGTAAGGGEPGEGLLRRTLVAYDEEVRASLQLALAAPVGVEQVRALHNRVLPAVAVHDAVVEWALCPVLDGLAEGRDLADLLRRGCAERAALVRRFQEVTRGVTADNVGRTAGDVVDEVLQGLWRSFDDHARDETAEVGEVLAAAAGVLTPEVVVDRMAAEARHAPTRVHWADVRRPRSALAKDLARRLDRWADWVDAHHGWAEPVGARLSPRTQQVDVLRRGAAQFTVGQLLQSYDSSVDELAGDLDRATTDAERGEAARRLCAAITIHDSVLGGVLAPLLQAVPGGAEQAERLHRGVLQRAELLQAWEVLLHRARPAELYASHRTDVDAVVARLLDSFRVHEHEGTLEVAELLASQPPEAFRTKASPLDDVMWPWHSEGHEVLALRMAMWANTAPTRLHPLLVRHPHSRTLRSWFHVTDHFRDAWHDTPVERWLFPRLPARPFAERLAKRR